LGYAMTRGYQFTNPGFGKGADHPVVSLNWFDSVKWCNARSQQAGLPPVYYTDAAMTQVYTKSLYENSNACGAEVRAGESVGNIEEKVHFH